MITCSFQNVLWSPDLVTWLWLTQSLSCLLLHCILGCLKCMGNLFPTWGSHNSKLFINELYCCKDMVLRLCKGTEVILILANYNYICWGAKSLSSQVSTALLTTALIIGLDYHLKERIPTLDGLLEVTVTPLHILLTIEHSTRFLPRKQ